MHKNMIFRISIIQNFIFRVLIGIFLLQSLGLSVSAQAADENYNHLLKGYSEAQKNQLKRVISFTTQKYPGKVVGITQQSDNEAAFFKVKLLNPQGQLKTYYLDKSISKISP